MATRGVGTHPDAFDPTARPTFAWGATTHVGGVRSHNEDAFYVSDDVCVVADGMGGHEAGEVASQLVTQLVSEAYGTRPLDVTQLPDLVSTLNAAVLRKGAENHTPGMGTTLVGVAVAGNGETPSAVVFHVGDSRCYRVANGEMTQLTTDHSHVQDLVELGRITQAEAATHPLRNVITRALGADVAVEADFHVLSEVDCRLLLCSDGLSGELDDDRILELLTAHLDPSAAAAALVEAVLEGPARDNVTAIVLDVAFPPAAPTDELPRPSVDDRATDITAEFEVGLLAAVTATVDMEPPAAITAEVDIVDAGVGSPEIEMVDVPWAPPVPAAQPATDLGRPSARPDGAAWGAPNPPFPDPTP
jgi:protein phosphatase